MEKQEIIRFSVNGVNYQLGIPENATLQELQDLAASFGVVLPQAFIDQKNRDIASKINMANIPNWATWDEQQANDWGQTNIGTPLLNARTNLDVLQTLSLVTFKVAMNTMLDILDAMWTAQQAFARMLIALRDKNYPSL